MAFELPPLPYDRAALEPHISAETLDFHHGKHHKAYVDNLNKLIEGTEFADMDLVAIIRKSQGGIFNNAAQVWNHTFYWNCMSPNGGGEPTGKVDEAIAKAFGDFAKFKAHFTANATGIQGSGWSVLAWDSIAARLNVFQLFDQQGNVPVGTQPILMLDMWEHAFYLDYLNVKADYVKAFWNIVNWQDAQARFDAAKSQTAGLIVR